MFPYYVFLISFLFIPHTLQSDCMNLNNCATCNTSVQPPVCLSCLSQNYLLDGECNACDSSIYNCTLCNQTLNNSIYPYFSQCVNCSQCSNNCLNSFCVSCSPTQCFACSSLTFAKIAMDLMILIVFLVQMEPIYQMIRA